MRQIFCSLLAATLLLAHVECVRAGDIAVIVNPKVPVDTADAKSIGKIFLGKTTELASGVSVAAVDLPDGNVARDQFYQATTGKNADQLQAFWAREIFTGNSQPPESAADDEAVKHWVASHANGIGYINAAAVDSSVKALLKIP